MVLSKYCGHKYCDHPVFPCQGCGATVIQCKATQHNKNGWCCEDCCHIRQKEGVNR